MTLSEPCGLCRSASGLYDFANPCCRERYLLAEPRLPVRRAWLDQFERTHGQNEADRLREVLSAEWRRRKGDECRC